jgi:ornithine cyclodeaminase
MASIFCDTIEGATHEGGDLVIPLHDGVIKMSDIAGDLHSLARGQHSGRSTSEEITYFKSVGTALEDLAGAVTVWNARKS